MIKTLPWVMINLRLDIMFLPWDRKFWSPSTWKQTTSQTSWFKESKVDMAREKPLFFPQFKAALSCKLFGKACLKDWKIVFFEKTTTTNWKTAWKKSEELATGWRHQLWKLRCCHVSLAINPVPSFSLREQDLFLKQKYDLRTMIFTYLVVMIVSDGITSTVTSRSVKKYTRTKKEIDATN